MELEETLSNSVSLFITLVLMCKIWGIALQKTGAIALVCDRLFWSFDHVTLFFSPLPEISVGGGAAAE